MALYLAQECAIDTTRIISISVPDHAIFRGIFTDPNSNDIPTTAAQKKDFEGRLIQLEVINYLANLDEEDLFARVSRWLRAMPENPINHYYAP